MVNVSHKAEPARLLWGTVPSLAFVGAAEGAEKVREFGVPEGSFDIRDHIVKQCDNQSP